MPSAGPQRGFDTEQRNQAIAAFPKNCSQLQKENKIKNDEARLLKANLEAQMTKFEAQVTEQSAQIHRLNLDLRSKQLSFEDLEKTYLVLVNSNPEEEAHIAEAERGKNEALEIEIKELKTSVDSKDEAING